MPAKKGGRAAKAGKRNASRPSGRRGSRSAAFKKLSPKAKRAAFHNMDRAGGRGR